MTSKDPIACASERPAPRGLASLLRAEWFFLGTAPYMHYRNGRKDFFKDPPELITIAVLMAAHTTLEVLAKHSAADPAEMAQRVEAFIIELHRPQRKVA